MAITIYSTASCPRCKALAAALHVAGISHEEKPLDVPTMTECACDTGISVREAPLVQAGTKWIFANQLFDQAGLLTNWRETIC